jgi:LacI family gluconate utilization system Gnt-I transcriptional repressor
MPRAQPRKAIRLGLNATMRDVAGAAGVSLITVSRAMREPHLVDPETRAQVERAMAEIGYLPHMSARGLVSQRRGIVAAVVPSVGNPVYAATIRGLSDGLRASGMQLLIGNTDSQPEREDQVIGALLAQRPDGIMLTGTTHPPRARRILETCGIPIVETWSLTRARLDMAVGFDNREAHAAMARHLLGRGYRRFAYVCGPLDQQERWRQRLAGFRAALAEAGLSLPDAMVFARPASMTAGFQVMADLAAARIPVDAVACAGDIYALGALLACQRGGLSVPGDVAIAGFGDFEMGSLTTPALTTIRIPTERIGACAAQLILERLERGAAARRRTVDVGFTLVVRDSA